MGRVWGEYAAICALTDHTEKYKNNCCLPEFLKVTGITVGNEAGFWNFPHLVVRGPNGLLICWEGGN